MVSKVRTPGKHGDPHISPITQVTRTDRWKTQTCHQHRVMFSMRRSRGH
jgi:hypothetical protein